MYRYKIMNRYEIIDKDNYLYFVSIYRQYYRYLDKDGILVS